MIENELKFMLSHEQFNQVKKILSKRYGASSCKVQINYYYDSNNFSMLHFGNSLRVRQKDNNISIEYKCKKTVSEGIRKCEEFKKKILHFPYTIVLSKELSIDDDKVYNYIGNLITERTNFKIGSAVVSLDKNYYLGKIDYELEIESRNSETIKNIQNLIASNLPINNMGKYKRFYNVFSDWSKEQ